MLKLVPKNWQKFQHYNNRKPPWIKLHRDLLDDYEFSCLPVASRALAPLLWLLASEYENGVIEASEDKLAFRLHMTVHDLKNALLPLIDKGFVDDASGLLARCKPDATLEIEREVEKEIEIEAPRVKRAVNKFAEATALEFENQFWTIWPNRVDRKAAAGAFFKARKAHDLETILDGVRSYAANKPDWQAWKSPAAWLNGEKFLDKPAVSIAGNVIPHPHEFERHQQRLREEAAKQLGIAL